MSNWQKSILKILQGKFGGFSSSSFANVFLYDSSSEESATEYSIISFSYPFKGFSGLFLSSDIVGYDFSRVLDVILNNSTYVQGFSSTMYFRPGILFDSPENSEVSCTAPTIGDRLQINISVSTGKNDYMYLFFPGRVFKGTLSGIYNAVTCRSPNFATKTITMSGDKATFTITYYLGSIVIRTTDSSLLTKNEVGAIFVLGLLYSPTNDTIYPAMAVPSGDSGSSFYVFVKSLDTGVLIDSFHYLASDDLTNRYLGSGIESILGYFKSDSQNSSSLLNKVLSFYSYPWAVRRSLNETLIKMKDFTENLNVVSVNWAIVPQRDYFIPLALVSAKLTVSQVNSTYYEASIDSIGSLYTISNAIFVENGSVGGHQRGVLLAPKYGKYVPSDIFGLGEILGFSDMPGDNFLNDLLRIKSAIVSTAGEAASAGSTSIYENKKLLALGEQDNRINVDLISTLRLNSSFREELEIFDEKSYPETVIEVPLGPRLDIGELGEAIQAAVKNTAGFKSVRLKFYTKNQKYLNIRLDTFDGEVIADRYNNLKFPMYTILLPQVPKIILDFSHYDYIRFSLQSSDGVEKMNTIDETWKLRAVKNYEGVTVVYEAISKFALVFKVMRDFQYVELYGLRYCSSDGFPVKIAIGHNYEYESNVSRYSIIKVKDCCIRDFDIFGSKGYSHDTGQGKYRIYHYPSFDPQQQELFFYDVYLSIENSTVYVYPYGYIENSDEVPYDFENTRFLSGFMVGWWPGCEPVELYLQAVGG
jgi:hypothetical protein